MSLVLLSKNDTEKLLFAFYKLAFLLAPIPIFFDFGEMGLYLIATDEYSISNRPSIPFPIGGIALAMSITIACIMALFRRGRMLSLISSPRVVIAVMIYIFAMAVHSFFVAGLTIPRFVQLMFPAIFLAAIAFPEDQEDRISALKFYITGVTIVTGAHFVSLLCTSENIFFVDARSEYSSIFGLLIYQSLVSYPGFLSLALVLVLSIIYRKCTSLSLGESRLFFLSISMLPFILIFLGLSSGRKAFIVEVVSALFLVCSAYFLYMTVVSKIFLRSLLFLFFLILYLMFWAILYLSSDLSSRLIWSIKTGSFDSGRLDILQSATGFFWGNPEIFLFGGGEQVIPGFHNFFLDQIYRVGFLATFASYFLLLFLFRRLFRINNIYRSVSVPRNTAAVILASCLFWQSMVNSSVSQPYYLINAIVVAYFVIFVVFVERDRCFSRWARGG